MQKDPCTLIFIAALCNSQDVEPNPVSSSGRSGLASSNYIYAVEYYSAMKKTKNVICHNRMDLEMVIPSKIIQTEKYKYHISLICGTKISNTNKVLCETETDSQNRRVVAEGWGWSVEGWGLS